MPGRGLPPLEFLLDASKTSLQDLEMAALSRSSNLGKGMRSELEAWIEESATAMLARWMIENRDALLRGLTNEQIEEFGQYFESANRRKSA